MKRPILITGIPRSGTSMTAGIIDLCGAYGGETSPPNKYNPKGMYENSNIRNEIMKPFLQRIGCDPKGQKPLPQFPFREPYPELRTQVLNILKSQGLRKDQQWYYKGCKMVLTWPVWVRAFPEAKWIIVRRPDEMILNSIEHTGFMSKRKTVMEWKEWIVYHKQRFLEMEMHCDVSYVWTDQIIAGDYDGIGRILMEVGLPWRDEIFDFVDPTLYSTPTKQES